VAQLSYSHANVTNPDGTVGGSVGRDHSIPAPPICGEVAAGPAAPFLVISNAHFMLDPIGWHCSNET
jgi:hypothetical protein